MRSHLCLVRRARCDRRGSLVVIVLVMLIVVTLLASAIFGGLLLGQRRARASARQEQAEWLLESACQRARYALANHQDYTGESWELPAEAWGGPGSALATIEVEDGSAPNGSSTVRVTLTVTEANALRIQLHRTVRLKRTARPTTSSDNQN